MQAFRAFGERTFSSLAIRNYRIYAVGQGVSLCGTWMQTIAQGLLVLRLTGSGTALGLVTALQTVPVLLLGPWGGVIADRFPKRRILYATQAAACLLGVTMGILVIGDWIRLWMVYVTGALLGLIRVFDNPTRQTFVREMVGKEQLANAVSLNSTEMNLARAIGPTVAGVLIATAGIGLCFLLDGLSYLVVLLSLARMRAGELHPSTPIPAAKGQLVAGFRYVRSSPVLLNVLLMMAIIGTLTYEFSVSLPLLAEFTFERGESGYAALTAAMGIGAVAGGLYTAGKRRTSSYALAVSALLFGTSVLLVAAAPTLALAVVAMLIVGFFSINFTSLGNVTLQMNSSPDMQGRVMALWTVAFLGTTPIGGPAVGWIGEHIGARWALVVGGIAALLAAALGFASAHHQAKRAVVPAEPAAVPLTDRRQAPSKAAQAGVAAIAASSEKRMRESSALEE
jgi:MFS family permease